MREGEGREKGQEGAYRFQTDVQALRRDSRWIQPRTTPKEKGFRVWIRKESKSCDLHAKQQSPLYCIE
jgi:hypothetical protein